MKTAAPPDELRAALRRHGSPLERTSQSPATDSVSRRRGPGFSRPISRPAVLAGILMFLLSLWPSLLPKLSVTQGIVSGISFMVGYGLGAGWQWAWHYLGLSRPHGRVWTALRWLWFALLTYLLLMAMWRFVGWQNDMRDTLGME